MASYGRYGNVVCACDGLYAVSVSKNEEVAVVRLLSVCVNGVAGSGPSWEGLSNLLIR